MKIDVLSYQPRQQGQNSNARVPWSCGCNTLGTRVNGHKEATYPLMFESGVENSWDGLSDDLKDELLVFMAVNDIAESSFAGVTAQLQVFGRIGMASAADIRNMARNIFLDQPTTNMDMSDKKTSLFHDLPEELQITAIMCTVQEAPNTIQSNTDDMYRHSNSKKERDKLVKR